MSAWSPLNYSVGHRLAALNHNQLTGVLEVETASETEAALVPALNNRTQILSRIWAVPIKWLVELVAAEHGRCVVRVSRYGELPGKMLLVPLLRRPPARRARPCEVR